MSTNANESNTVEVKEEEMSELKSGQENSVTSSDDKKELENSATTGENKDHEHEKVDIDKEQSGKEETSKNSDGKKENEKKESSQRNKKVESDKKDNGKKESDKEDNEKDESDKEDNEKDESEKEESEDEQELGLLDRPVEVVTGCRARKQVERLEVSFALPKKDKQIPEGRGAKLGDCPRIEFQIAKHAIADLKPLHRVLFNRQGTANDTKRNIRKFSGFPYDEKSSEFEKTKARAEKCSTALLKKMCDVLDLERSGTKEDIIMRILQFLVCPRDSGKALPKKKSAGRDKKTAAKKKSKGGNKKSKAKSSEEEEGDDEIAPSADEASDASANEEETSDVEIKKKSNAKNKKAPIKVKTVKKEKANKETKGIKRKKNISESSDEDSEPAAKKSKLPGDEEIEKLVRTILDKADLHEITMKKVIKQVYDTYPGCDLTDKKSFIKQTIKTVLHLSEKGEAEDR